MNILAIIPARGGSKGLPDKNILPLLGHPLISYSVKAAQNSKYINRVIVSTDSERIAEAGRSYGAEIPFMRPAEYAQDLSTDLEVFQHALNWLKEHENYIPDYVIQLRPTSPVRQANLIDACIERMLNNKEADSLRIVTPSPITPYKMWTLTDEEHPMSPLLSIIGVNEPYNEPRQRLPQTYWQIGTLDVIRPHVITEQHSMSGNVIMPYIVDNIFAIDIDELSSFQKAEEVILKYDCVKFDA